MTPPLPRFAFSVRQPWTYALVQRWKDLENRSWRSDNPAIAFRGRFCLHASAGMTQDEYREGRDFMASLGHELPGAADLPRGGIVAIARVVSIVRHAAGNPWFRGPLALLIADMTPIPFIPCGGQLGFFEWHRIADDQAPKPAKWMLPRAPESQQDLFADQAINHPVHPVQRTLFDAE